MSRTSNLVRPVAYPAIDGLRTYAALTVFFFHIGGAAVIEYFRMPAELLSYKASAWQWRALNYLLDGNHGVDVFFIISGFLMSRIVLSDRTPFSYSRFLSHRFWRIYPAFLISLIVTTAADIYLFDWPWKPGDFLKNLVFLNAIQSLGVLPYNHVSWSLGFEFAFYLVIPILTVMAMAVDKRLAAIAMLIAAFFLLPSEFVRMLGLFAGAIVGSLSDANLRRIARAIPLWLIVALYLGCGLSKALWSGPYLSYYYPFLSVATVAFVKIVWDDQCVLHRVFSMPAMRALGTLSYSIYLFHSVVGPVVLYKLTPLPASLGGLIWYITASLALTIAVAYLSYMLVERLYFLRRSPKTTAAEVVARA